MVISVLDEGRPRGYLGPERRFVRYVTCRRVEAKKLSRLGLSRTATVRYNEYFMAGMAWRRVGAAPNSGVRRVLEQPSYTHRA